MPYLHFLAGLLILFHQIEVAKGQYSASATCVPQAKWVNNAMGDSPCLLWAKIMSFCDPSFEVTALNANSYYLVPGADGYEADDCDCNVVTYNLMAACSYCQAGVTTWYSESKYKADCVSYNSTGVTGIDVKTLDIPAWAYLSDNGSIWNANTAQAFYFNSEAAASATSPTSSTTTSATSTMSASSSATASAEADTECASDHNNGTETGDIVGAAFGGFVGGLILAVAGYFFLRYLNQGREGTHAEDVEEGNAAFQLNALLSTLNVHRPDGRYTEVVDRPLLPKRAPSP